MVTFLPLFARSICRIQTADSAGGSILPDHCDQTLRSEAAMKSDSPLQPRPRSARRRPESPAAALSSSSPVCLPTCLPHWPPAAIYTLLTDRNLVSPSQHDIRLLSVCLAYLFTLHMCSRLSGECVLFYVNILIKLSDKQTQTGAKERGTTGGKNMIFETLNMTATCLLWPVY